MTTLEDLRKLASRAEDAARQLDSLRQQRDDAIRKIRKTTSHTVAEIADAAGVSQATVKTVIRGVR